MEKIEAIGNVTLDSKEAIEAARAAYESLTEDQKALVSEEIVKALEDAEAKLEELETEEDNKDDEEDNDKPVIIVPSKPITTKPVETVKFPFTDVAADAWYYDEVKEAWQNDLIDGMTADKFDPNGNLTVAQAIKLAAALHQMEKSGKVTLKNGDDIWYTTYVEYAIANGIIDGAYGDYTYA